MEVIEKIAKDYAYECIVFCGDKGDCIYHPRFLDIIRLLKKYGKYVNILTNGSGKPIDWWEELFSMLDHRDTIEFAMDGMEDTCGIYRVNFKNKDFLHNLEVIKLASDKFNIDVRWSFIIMNFNAHQIQKAGKLAIKHGATLMIKKSGRWKSDSKFLPEEKWIAYTRAQMQKRGAKAPL